MGFHRLLQWFVMFTFLVEVVSPTTTFVREQVNPVQKKKVVKVEKQTSVGSSEQSDSNRSDSTDSDDDYLACSAILPSMAFHPQPFLRELALTPLTSEPTQAAISSILKPPSRS